MRLNRAKVEEALDILKQLGFPHQQQNDRSALTLLALLDLKPSDSWSSSSNPMLGITPMMDWFKKYYGKNYAPNSRETVRRQTVHQFLQAALIVENPDKPDRPTNSGKTVYQIDGSALELLRLYGTDQWTSLLDMYLKERPALQEIYEKRRSTGKIPIKISSRMEVRLSSGGQNALVGMVCAEFVQRFVPDGVLLYVGDTAKKFVYFDRQGLEDLGVALEPHGKIPDVVIHDVRHNWLFLVEAVTSHGPINAKRRKELQAIFAHSKAKPVYVTAFSDRNVMKRFITDISWETEVWVADTPDHMIHFNGERFLGPYA
ncbi:MAG: restriction endonuclease [Cenarchaeum sp. SB0662_bin_33]|nr:restriction endonuclease [Cenarchaeum sp. SB0662_bin_33]